MYTSRNVLMRVYRSAWSRAKPVKLKKLRYSSATMRLKSLLQRQTCKQQHLRTSLPMFWHSQLTLGCQSASVHHQLEISSVARRKVENLKTGLSVRTGKKPFNPKFFFISKQLTNWQARNANLQKSKTLRRQNLNWSTRNVQQTECALILAD